MDFVPFIEIDGVAYENQIVPRNYRLNPVEDDLIYADEMVDGMRVLLGESVGRFDESQPEFHNVGLLVVNRWCVVSKLRVENNHVYFVGVYDDGDKNLRGSDLVSAWLVKKNSIPVREETDAEDQTNEPASLRFLLPNGEVASAQI